MESDKYWAALDDAAEFGAELKRVVEDSAKAPVVKTVLDEQRNAYMQLFAISLGGTASSSRIMRDGEQGELAAFRVPMASALANAVVNLITGQKITWQCQATRSDADSRAQTALGNQALEYYWHDRGGEQFAESLPREGVPFGECFGFIEYDEQAGEMVSPPVPAAPATGLQPPADESMPTPNTDASQALSSYSAINAQNTQLARPAQEAMPAQYEGDVRFNAVSSWDVARDPRSRAWEDCDWVALRLRRNKYDLAAKYGPEVLDACVQHKNGILPTASISDDRLRGDLVDCWYFFHKRTPAVPQGKQAVLVGDKVFALDQLRYRRIPVVRFFTGRLTGTPYPFAPFWTALASQELQDSLLSSIATNNLMFGTQMIQAPMGTEIEPDSFGPMRLILTPPGAGEAKGINFTQSAPETFKLYEVLKDDQRQLLGLNGTVLGQPESANLSGAAMALLSSMAIQANSSAQGVYVQAVKEIGNILIEIFQDFFTVEHKIRIAGKSMSYMAREETLSGEKLAQVNNVSVRVGNPLSQTTAGREALFDKYIQIMKDSGGALQLLKTPEDIQQLLDTGRLDGLTDPLRDQAILVEAENEQLGRGEPVTAILGDDDVYHCRHHRAVVTSLEARKNEALMTNALAHVHQHYENYFGVPATMSSVDPMTGQPSETFDPAYRTNMMILFGLQPPAPPPPMPGGGPPVDGAAPQPEGPGEPEGMPSMPENPLSGQQFDHSTGGGVVAPPSA